MDCDNVCPLDGHFFGGFSLGSSGFFWVLKETESLVLSSLGVRSYTEELVHENHRSSEKWLQEPAGGQSSGISAWHEDSKFTNHVASGTFFFMIFFLYKNPSFIGRLSFLYTSWCLGKWIVYLGECSSYTDPFLWAYPLPCPTLDLQELINKVIFSQWQSWCVPATILCTSWTCI